MPEGVAVVTGAGQGIGLAVAEAFAGAGYSVVVSDVDPDRAEAAATSIAAATSAHTVAHVADVSDEHAVAGLADAAAGLGPVAVWVNNAGVTRPAMLTKMAASDFDLVLAVHARGTFLGMREAARRMIETGRGGSIINVTSSAGLQGTIGQVNYAAAKGAITAMTKSGAKELARHGIRVNAVAPFAATPMTAKIREDEKLSTRYLEQVPMGRFAEPDEVAHAFLFLGSSAAGFVTGQVLCVDGGLYMAS